MRDSKRVAIVAGCRTPFARAGGALVDHSALDLARLTIAELVQRAELTPSAIDHIVFGNVVPDVRAPNLAREAALAAGLSPEIGAFTVSRACISSNQAIVSAAESIRTSSSEVAIAGGAESLSNVPILVSRALSRSLVGFTKAKRWPDKLGKFVGLRLRDLLPVPPAIAEYSTGLSMGESAERMAKQNQISREEQDAFALFSHQMAAAATEDGRLGAEIVRVYAPPDYERSLASDDGIRHDTDLESLARLKPVFDKRDGTLTAGNSSPLTDGAAALVLMSEERARSEGREPLGFIRSYAFAAVDPFDQLLIAPAYSTPIALDRAGCALSDMTLIDLHEAFAAQVLSVLNAWDSQKFAVEKLNRERAVGPVDRDRVNVMGGSIAIGHPFAATGARMTLSVLGELRRRGGGLGLVSLCAAGGMGFTMVLETE